MTPEHLAMLKEINGECEAAYDRMSAAIQECVDARMQLLAAWQRLNNFALLLQTYADVRKEMEPTP